MNSKKFVDNVTFVMIFTIIITVGGIASLMVHDFADTKAAKAATRIAEEKEFRRQQFVVRPVIEAAFESNFFEVLSPKETELWVTLVRDAQEVPNATLAKEYYFNGNTKVTPVMASVPGGPGVVYSVVVATLNERMGKTWFTPRLAYYTGYRHGGAYRYDRISGEPVEVRKNNGEWAKADVSTFDAGPQSDFWKAMNRRTKVKI